MLGSTSAEKRSKPMGRCALVENIVIKIYLLFHHRKYIILSGLDCMEKENPNLEQLLLLVTIIFNFTNGKKILLKYVMKINIKKLSHYCSIKLSKRGTLSGSLFKNI